MDHKLSEVNFRLGSYWYVIRTTPDDRFYPIKVTLNHGINTVTWSSNFEHAIAFPSEHAVQHFINRLWRSDDRIEIVHVRHGDTQSITRVK